MTKELFGYSSLGVAVLAGIFWIFRTWLEHKIKSTVDEKLERDKVVFANMYEKRTKVLEEFHTRLERLRANVMFSDFAKGMDTYSAHKDAISALNDYVSENSIYLPEGLALYINHCLNGLFDFMRRLKEAEKYSQEYLIWQHQKLQADLNVLENDIRKLLEGKPYKAPPAKQLTKRTRNSFGS